MESYIFDNGNQIQRVLTGIPTYVGETTHNTSLNYSLVDPDKYYFNATLRYSLTKESKKAHNTLFEKSTPERLPMSEAEGKTLPICPHSTSITCAR